MAGCSCSGVSLTKCELSHCETKQKVVFIEAAMDWQPKQKS
jgi:hypothetical protein